MLRGIGPDAGFQSLGGDEAGVDGVDAHAVLLATVGKRLGEVQQGSVDGAADREVGASPFYRRSRRR